MYISSAFDSGNIELVELVDRQNVRLKIRKDTNADFLQWFHFKVSGARELLCRYHIINAGETSYPEGWSGYHACASYDRKSWFRVPTFYEEGTLRIEHMPDQDVVYYAYFAPYSYERHLDFISHMQQQDNMRYLRIGSTVQGRDMDMMMYGEPRPEKKKLWIIARQHPGESMASWFMEGLMERLVSDDPMMKKILEKAVIYLVPNMNPDGAFAGNLRANAAGANLNREWAEPSRETSPEVYWVRTMMDQTGVDLMLDVHGDEGLPYNFLASIEGIPAYGPRLEGLLTHFKDAWSEASPEFQTEHGYGTDEPGKANLAICSKQIGQRFECLSMTVEMPFKDNNNLPDPVYGWSIDRCRTFGASALDAMMAVVDDLR